MRSVDMITACIQCGAALEVGQDVLCSKECAERHLEAFEAGHDEGTKGSGAIIDRLTAELADARARLALADSIIADLAVADTIIREHDGQNGRDRCSLCVSDAGYGTPVWHAPECPYLRAKFYASDVDRARTGTKDGT